MCGIAGFVGRGGIEDLKKMAALLVHRGPDGEGFYEDRDKSVYLGHRRLSIIDIPGGAQPMWTEDGKLGIVYNGEIYNHMEIRKELEIRGCKFRTNHSDTETLLLAYKEWGFRTPDKLNGMWAFAVYDKIKNEIFISRDRFGKKPLYYTMQNGLFAFSSELQSLVCHSHIQSNISERSLNKYFAYGYIPSPNSLFEKIYKLPAGYNLALNCNDLTYQTWKYWDFVIEPFDTIPKNPKELWGEEIRDLLSQAVKRRLMSDVPLGVFLSGGIDSSSITAFASKLIGSQRVKTFSTGFVEDSYDESTYSEYASMYFGTEHCSEVLSVKNAKTILDEVIDKLDEPMADSSLLPSYLLCKNTRKYVTVALGGDGADELFAGYDPFRALKMAEIYKAIIPKKVHKAIRMIASMIPVSNKNISLDFKIKRTLQGITYSKELWNPVWLGPVEPNDFKELFSSEIDIEDIYSEAIEHWDNCKQNNLIDKTLQFYTKMYLQESILTKIDRAGMMHSLEVRSPYLDIDFVNFVRKIPGCYKFRNGKTKYILKKALMGVLPEKIINREKHGFGMPVGVWFRKGDIRLNVLSTNAKINNSYLERIKKEHLNKKHDHRLILYSCYMLMNNLNKYKSSIVN